MAARPSLDQGSAFQSTRPENAPSFLYAAERRMPTSNANSNSAAPTANPKDEPMSSVKTVWAASYAGGLIFASLFFPASAIFRSPRMSHLLYKLACLAYTTGFGISLGRSLQSFQLSTPYVFLCVVMMFSYLPALLWPLSVYAGLHCLSFLSHNAAALVTSPAQRQALQQYTRIVLVAQPSVLTLAAHLECLLLPYILVRHLRHAFFAAFLFYPQFLRWQYALSAKTRNCFRVYNAFVQSAICHPSCPVGVKRIVIQALGVVAKAAPVPSSAASALNAANLNNAEKRSAHPLKH